MAMGNWKRKIIKKKGRGSQTTGKTKGINPSTLDRYMAAANRSYKHPGYAAWCAKYNGDKVQSKKG